MLDARLLVCAALGIDHVALVRDPDVALGERAAQVTAFAQRRLAREPVSRILGRREFWGLRLDVTPDVLDPRADSETLVEAALAALPDRAAPLRFLDLGTGSGALLCALLHEYPNASGVGTDLSPAGCAVAAANLATLGLAGRGEIVCGDWGAGLEERFDLVVSNPPYIESAAVATLALEVRAHDPRLSLDGGGDGLDCYRAILRQLPRVLAPSGRAVLEAGAGQAEAIKALAEAQGFDIAKIRHDFGGTARALVMALREIEAPNPQAIAE